MAVDQLIVPILGLKCGHLRACRFSFLVEHSSGPLSIPSQPLDDGLGFALSPFGTILGTCSSRATRQNGFKAQEYTFPAVLPES